MVLRLWQIAVVGVVALCAPLSVFAQRPPTVANNTATFGQAARILTNPTVPAPGVFVNPTYRSSTSGAYDSQAYGLRNTFPSPLLPTPGVFRPMPGASSSEMSTDDDDITRSVLPSTGPPSAGVFRPRPGDDLMAMSIPATPLATVVVKVPENAQVWFDNSLTQTTGTERSYETPPLTAGTSYQYEIKARWLQDGKAVERIRNVTIRSGERSVVDFADPAKP